MKKHAKVVIELDYWMDYDNDGLDSGIDDTMTDDEIRNRVLEWIHNTERTDFADDCKAGIKDVIVEDYE